MLNQKIVTKLFKYGFGIRDPEKIYSGSRILARDEKVTGSRIQILNTVVFYVIDIFGNRTTFALELVVECCRLV
jgi:hypothetical protein